MRIFPKSSFLFLALVSVIALPFPGATICLAQGKTELTGWEKGSEYDRHYKASEMDQFKGTIEDVTEIFPLPGMAPGIGLMVRDQDKDMVSVHLGPKAFVKLDAAGIKQGDKVKVKGAWSEIAGKELFIASKVKKGENIELKVRRTRDGIPYWSLSPEELSAEKESDKE